MNMSEQQLKELLDRYLRGVASPSEEKMLDEFFDSYASEVEDLNFLPAEKALRDEMLQNIHARVGYRKGPSYNKLVALWLPLAAAIAVFVVAYFFVDLPDESLRSGGRKEIALNTDTTAAGQRSVMRLPDGTTVHLNSNSTISYPQAFGPVREITLEGEAFFEVAKNGKPFVVYSGNVKTQVLGTSFNVKNRAGKDIEITLVKGKVGVVSPSGELLTLEPSQQAVIGMRSNEMIKRSVNVLRYTGWKDNVLFFEQTSLAEVIDTIEEWYGVDIDIANPSIGRCAITAKYQNEPLGNVLSSLQFLFGLNIKRVDSRRYVIGGGGC